MLKMSEEDKKFIISTLGKEALEYDDRTFFDKLSDYMLDTGFDKDWEITDYGREIERLYDRIFYQNSDEE
jgi:hypothetical protein